MSESTLSPAPSANFEEFIDDKIVANNRLANYQPTVNEKGKPDKLGDLLKACYKYFPPGGQRNLAEEIRRCRDDDEIRQLARSIETALLRPLRASGGLTPALVDSPHPGYERSHQILHSEPMDSASRDAQQKLRERCLERDGYRCVITGARDPESVTRDDPEFNNCSDLQLSHILPFAIGAFKTEDEKRRIYKIWEAIFYYFPGLQDQLGMSPGDVNREDNVFMIDSVFHRDFGQFRLVLDATDSPDRYRVHTFRSFHMRRHFIPLNDGVITLRDHHQGGRYALPNPQFLQIHAAIGHILNASGFAEEYDQILREYGEIRCLSQDGQTNVGALLSMSNKLDALSLDENTEESKGKRQERASRLPGTENTRPIY